MAAIELALLAVAYTGLITSLTLGIICYKRNLESIETIAFIISLLLLIVSITASQLTAAPYNASVSNLSILLCMAVVSSTTLLNTLGERRHSISSGLIKVHTAASALLFAAVLVSYFTGHLQHLQWPTVLFLLGSVAASMIIIRVTKPKGIYAHLEKSNRVFSAIFFVLIPLYLILHFGVGTLYAELRIGFILPLVFILLGAHKTLDDFKRLSITTSLPGDGKQQFLNYGLTDRECDVAGLLLQGSSYQAISDQLFISLPTVKTHSSNIYKKCSVKNRLELIRLLAS